MRVALVAVPLGLIGTLSACSSGADSSAARLASERDVQAACSFCHDFVAPELLSRAAWKDIIGKMYASYMPLPPEGPERPPIDVVEEYFLSRAPEAIPFPPSYAQRGSGPLTFERRELASPAGDLVMAVAGFTQIETPAGDSQILIADMLSGGVGRWHPESAGEPLELLFQFDAPVRMQQVDFDRDGLPDLIVADLGALRVDDHDRGKVWWLRAQADGGYSPVPLLQDVGRVSDASAGDLDGDGDMDLIVCEFGWLRTGRVYLLENTAGKDNEPSLRARVLDDRTGALRAPLLDLDGDGSLDFVTFFSQQHEVLVAFLNRGDLEFEARTLFKGPHAGWGATGFDFVDLDGDGDLDVLMTNGDTLDTYEVKPIHGVHWLENNGEMQFERRELAILPGAHSARACDLDGDGDLDVAVSTYLSARAVPASVEASQVESVIWLEQTEPGRFSRHSLEAGRFDHAALECGDFDGDGDVDIVVGSFNLPGQLSYPEATVHPLTLFENKQVP